MRHWNPDGLAGVEHAMSHNGLAVERGFCTLLIACMACAGCGSRTPQDITTSWYPLEPGDTWVYQKESRDGDMTHPDVERWTTEETIANVEEARELAGTLVTKRTKVLSDTVTPGFLAGNDLAKREPPETHLLIHQGCLYALDGWGAACAQVGAQCVAAFDGSRHVRREYRDALLRGDVAADLCFPMAKGTTWGKVASTSPAEEYVWRVEGLNADLFGRPGGNTFHLVSYEGSGGSIDRWFEQGAGVVQQVAEHHGTYDEIRQQLVSATVHGNTQSYQLTPARIVPSGPEDCEGPRWRHFSRADGVSFTSLADCIGYSANRK